MLVKQDLLFSTRIQEAVSFITKFKFAPEKNFSTSARYLDGNCIVVSVRNVFVFSALNMRKISGLTLKTNNFKSCRKSLKTNKKLVALISALII